MMNAADRLSAIVAGQGACALVTIVATKGSVPRDAGARMIVRRDGGFHGTIGGGRLEWDALAEARRMLEEGRESPLRLERVLGPDLGQCCGGVVSLRIERVDASSLNAVTARMREEDRGEEVPVALFGAGHVGRALALALAPLPFRVRWADARPDAFPDHVPGNAQMRGGDPVMEVAAAENGSLLVVVTHDHALDLAIVDAALSRGCFPYVGLIGSATKRARFVRRLAEAGLTGAALAPLVCPIGVPGIAGKEPAVIAAGIAAQLLLERGRVRAAAPIRETRSEAVA